MNLRPVLISYSDRPIFVQISANDGAEGYYLSESLSDYFVSDCVSLRGLCAGFKMCFTLGAFLALTATRVAFHQSVTGRPDIGVQEM